jgi:CHAD domain-containing protein
MGTSRQLEIERKYEVGPELTLPPLAGADGISSVGEPVEFHLEAVYFDTADFTLARHGVTLRRRSGGSDAGWHLKLPRGANERVEVRLPPSDGDAVRDDAPAELLPPIRAMVRDRPIRPVVQITTRRVEHALIGGDARVLALVSDDDVRAEPRLGGGRVQRWREWEVELVEGGRSVLDVIEGRFLSAGASVATTSSKLARALGDALPPRVPTPDRKELARGSAAHLLTAHLVKHIAKLQQHDAGVRAAEPQAVHKMRIAARRLRSALTTYGPVLRPDAGKSLRDELRWLGQILSEARDAEVLRERLDRLVAGEPAELVLGSVAARIDSELGEAERAGRLGVLHALDSERYFRLLGALDDLVRSLPGFPHADLPARAVVPDLLRRDAKRLRRAVRAIERAGGAHERDLAFHEMRKKAKRLRYAAESAVPVCGARAKRLASAAKRIQEVLGEHQDAVVARGKLREYGVQAQLAGENAFAFGRLHAFEEWHAAQAEDDFTAAWEGSVGKLIVRWTRK